MPIVNGKVVRARYTSLKLDEVSSVDNPAQPGATASICKRFTPEPVAKGSWLARSIAKYIDEDDGAHTFDEVLSANTFDEEIWPMVSALSQSLRSIMGDATVTAADRQTKVQASVDQFLAAVRELDPPADPAADTQISKVEKQLRELIRKKESPTMKTVEQLQAEIETLKGQLTAAQGEVTTAKAALETEQTAHGETKKALVAATDETFKTADGTEVKKSELGASFPVLKASEERAQMAVLEKRATTEFPHLVGTSTEKALVLKHAESLPEDAKKATLAILNSAEKMAANGFATLGYREGGDGDGDVAKARSTFTEKVSAIQKRDNCTEADAMSKARRENPTEFAAAYPEQAQG